MKLSFLLFSIHLASAPVTAAPVVTPTPCKDDPEFRFKQERDLTCKWVAEKPLERCEKEWKRIELSYYCPRSCGACGPSPAPSTPPSGLPSTPPTAAPVTPAPTGCDPELCFNDPDFKHKNCGKFDCKWVAKNPDSRCEKKNGYSSCPESCAASAFCLEVASKAGSKGCAGDFAFICPVTCGLCDFCPETSTRVSVKPFKVSRGGCPAPDEAVRSRAPTGVPSSDPTFVASTPPTYSPTAVPTSGPTSAPTAPPTFGPTNGPTYGPTSSPSAVPTDEPTSVPSSVPTSVPSSVPTFVPSSGPSAVPSIAPPIEVCIGNPPSTINCFDSAIDDEVDVYNRALTGSLPTEIGLLSRLTRFTIYANSFSGTLPSEIGQLTLLTELSVAANDITGTIPSELGLLAKLEILHLANSFETIFTGTLPTEIGQLTELKTLISNGNDMTGTLPSEIGMLTNLETIQLLHNYFTGTIPSMENIPTLNQCLMHNNLWTDTSNAPPECTVTPNA